MRTAKLHRTSAQAFGSRKPRLERLEDRLALAAFGPEDGSYIVAPWAGSFSDVKIQPGDQAIVAVGKSGLTSSSMQIAVSRFDSQGNTDATYGSGGLATVGPTGATASGLALQPDGKAVVSASVTGTNSYDIGVGRLNSNGSSDTSFSGDGWTSVSTASGSGFEAASGVGLQSNGDIVIGGVSNVNGSTAAAASFRSGGALDSGKGGFGQSVQGKPAGYVQSKFGSPYSGFWGGVAVQPDNKVVAVGSLSTDMVAVRLLVARYTADGKLDTTLNGSGYSVFAQPPGLNTTQANAVALQSDGKIVVAGVASGIDGSSDMLVARYNPNGTLDGTFGGGSGYVRLDIDGLATVTNEQAFGVAVQPDGKIVVAGKEFLQADTSRKHVLVARLHADGTPDGDFGLGGFKLGSPPAGHSFSTEAVALQSDGHIIVAGFDTYFDGDRTVGSPLLMRFSGAATAPAAVASSTAPTSIAIDAALLFLLTEELATPTNKRK